MADQEYEQIRKRHSHIRQDALFDVDTATAGTQRAKPEREKTIRTARCPGCWRSNKKVGVVRRDDIEVFRDHDKFTVSGTRLRCNGSGQEAPLQ